MTKLALAATVLLAAVARGAAAGTDKGAVRDWEKSSRLPGLVAEPLPGDGLRTTVHRLKNGLTIYLSPNRERPRISAWIAVRAGSRHDPSDLTGMAHYLEHMFFKGSRRLGTLDFASEKPRLDAMEALYEERFASTDTARRQELYGRIDRENIEAAKYAVPNEIDRAYKQLGVRGINAFTSNEMTVYICDLPRNRLAAWARLESDRFQAPVFRLFQSEIETVYEEKNRSMDNAGRILDEALSAALFGDHPYGRTTLGSMEHLKNPSLARLYAFARRHYVPNNMAIALAGDFDRAGALALLERWFGAWLPGAVEPPEAIAVPKPTAPVRVEVRYESEEQAVIAWPLPPYGHPDRDALTVLSMVMDNGQSGIVNLDLNQAQKVRRAGAGVDLMNEGGSFELWAVPKEGQTLEEAEALLLGSVKTLQDGGFAAEDLSAIITNFEIAEKRKLESNDSRVGQMAMAFLHYEEWPHAALRLERLKKVSKEDVVRAARAYLGEGRVSAFRRKGKPVIPSMQKPGFTKVELGRGRESAFFRELVAMPAKPIEPRWLVPGRDYKAAKAPWGRLVAAKNPYNDLFALDFVFDRGWRNGDRNLCAALDLLNLSGAGELTAEAFKKRLYGLGAFMSTSCGEDRAVVSLSGLERGFDEALGLMRLRFEAPQVATDTLKKMVEVRIGAHKDNKVNPGYVNHALGEWAARGAESEVLGELSDAELRALDEARLKKVLNGFFDHQRRAGYVGSAEPGALVRRLGLGRGFAAPPAREPLRYRRPGRDEVIFTHRDMVQSLVGLDSADEVYDGGRAVDYGFYADYMGGGMSAVIFQEVREARSLAYSASGGYAQADRKEDENLLWGALGTQADKTVEAAALLKGLLTRAPLTEERFKETKRAIEERYRTSPIEFRAVPGAIFGWEDHGFAKDPRPERFKKALAYTLSDLEGFASRFERSPKSITVLGSRSRVDLEGLKKLGAFSEKPLDELFPY